jgi:TolB protein
LPCWCSPALAQRNIGSVEVNVDSSTVPVRVSANTPELNALVLQAFKAHGRYRLVASGQAYDIRFTLVGTNQVRVDISRGSAASPVGSEVATGGTARQALLKAADIAVAKTNGLGLRGFLWLGSRLWVSARARRNCTFPTSFSARRSRSRMTARWC